MRKLLFSFALVIALCATGCNRGEAPPHDEADPLLLRTYPVPVDRTEQIADALNTIFQAGEGLRPVGRASPHVPGRIPVLAPMSMHASIAKSIEELTGGTPTAPPPQQTVRMRYWLVDAVHSEGQDDPALTAIAPVLDAARATLGSTHFRLADYGEGLVASNAGGSSVSTGQRNRFETELRGGGDRLRAQISVMQRDIDTGMLSTTIDLVPGQFLVLAQAMTAPAAGDTAARSRLVIVQAQPQQAD